MLYSRDRWGRKEDGEGIIIKVPTWAARAHLPLSLQPSTRRDPAVQGLSASMGDYE